MQGTIYPDVIESGSPTSAVIKSHHNVGGLPSVVDFKEILEPLRDLFKDEVRKVGVALGLPDSIVMRQPFPGPGLAIRVLGEITPENSVFCAKPTTFSAPSLKTRDSTATYGSISLF